MWECFAILFIQAVQFHWQTEGILYEKFFYTFRLSQGHAGAVISTAKWELLSGYSQVAQFILQSRDMHSTMQYRQLGEAVCAA